MNGKTKIVAAVAAGAVALTIGAGAARCSMDAPDAQTGQQAPQEQASGKQDDAKASQSSQQAPDERLSSESEFSSLANTSWTSRDGASKLSITKDALIERTADSASVIYCTVSDEKTDAAGLSVTLSTSEDIAVPGADTVVRIENEGASTTLTCDLLKAIYVQDGKTQTALSVAGDVQDLCALTGKNEADFESVLESFAKAHSPYATSAAWDKEVWIDYDAHSTLTTFTLDDAASTIVTVSVSQDGAMEAV